MIFFEYPMITTGNYIYIKDYVILNSGPYQGNAIYTYNVPVGNITVANTVTGVALGGFSSQELCFALNATN